jgi:sugar phosphate permease
MSIGVSPTHGPAYRWLIFTLLALAYLLVYFHRTSPAVVALEMMADLKADGALMGWLGSAYFYPYALMQLPAGLLADSWGPRRTITTFFLLAGVACLGLGLADGPIPAIAARVLVGLGVSTVLVSTMKALTRWFSLDQFARMMGVLMAVGGLGVLSAAAPLAWLSSVLGWRGAFMSIGVLTLASAGAIWVFVRNTPQELGLPEVAPAWTAAQVQPNMGMGRAMALVLKERGFWALALWALTSGGIFFSFGGLWAGPFLRHVYGMSKTEAGGVLNMLAVGMVVGSPLLSWLSDRVLHSRRKVLLLASILLLVLATWLALFTADFSRPLLYLWFFLFSLASSASVVVAFACAKELFPLEMAGTSTGMVNLFPFTGGAILQPALGALLQMQSGQAAVYTVEAYGSALWVYVGCAVLALAACLFIRETLAPVRARE